MAVRTSVSLGGALTRVPRNGVLLVLCYFFLAPLAPRPAEARGAYQFYVAAPRNFLLDDERIFRPKGERLPFDALLKDARNHVELQIGRKAFARVANARELSKVMAERKDYADGLLLGREWLNLGEEHYDSLRVEESLIDLRRAEDVYLRVFHDVVEPFAFARVFLLQGLSFLEQGRTGESHIAFRRLFFTNPWVRFDAGYYPKHAEDGLRSSAVDFLMTYPKELPFLGEERLARFLEAFPFDYLVYLYVDSEPEGLSLPGGDATAREHAGPRLHILVYGRGSEEALLHEVIGLGETPAADREDESHVIALARVDEAISRWMSCLDLRPPKVAPKEAKRFGFSVSSTHSTWLTTPSRSLFYSLGYGIEAFYALNKNVELNVTSELYTSIIDQHRDLQRNFNTLRVLMGVGFTFGSDRIKAFIEPSLDVHYLGDFQIVTDPFCKLYGTGEGSPCDRSSVFSLDLNMLFGMNANLGGRFYLTDHLFLQVSASVSTYFMPFNRVIDLNFPVSAGAGLGYRL